MKKRSQPPLRNAAATGRRARGRARYEVAPDVTPHAREESPTTSGSGREKVVSATEAARNFSELINRVCYQGEVYIVERGGRAMCELSPVGAGRCSGADLLALLSSLAPPAEEFLAAVEDVTRHQAAVEPSPWEK